MEDTKTLDLFAPDNGDEASPIEQHASHAYLGYAVSTVKARALPEIADGLKPVQRRILYAMGDAGGTGFAKCARYVGEVLGKYHPHGDSSTYEALVHLAQPFSMRYPLIDGQGNFGSRDGDAPAAYRYTEARLSGYAGLMLAEIGEGTVDFVKNYDGKFEEPLLLPARLPFGLLNGSFGIPVGFSTRIPSHNLKEVAAAAAHVIRHPRAKLEDVLERMPGPDFPGGGQIISPPEEIRQAYETGGGSRVLKCKWEREQLARGQWRIVISELPHGVSVKQVSEEIEALANPKPGLGKKEVSQEQKRMKQFILDQIDQGGVRDESDRKSRLRLVIEPRSSRQNPEELMADAARAHRARDALRGQPHLAGARRPARDQGHRRSAARVGRVPRRHRAPPHPVPPRQVRGAAAHRRGPAQGLREDRRDHQADPLERGPGGSKAQAAGKIQVHRAPGRGHRQPAPRAAHPAGRGEAERGAQGPRGREKRAEAPPR